jgi:hypothetical protein
VPNKFVEQRRHLNRCQHRLNKIRWLAYHEAAHAVVAASFGKAVEQLTLDGFDYQGRCRWVPDGEVWPKLVVIAAGTAAERFAGRLRETEWAGGTDFQTVSDLAQGDPALIAAGMREAMRRVEQFWPTIEAIAVQLQELGDLQGDALTRALLPVRPAPPPSAARTRALDPGRSIFKPIRTVKDKNGIELGELWSCEASGVRWLEAYIFVGADGGKKSLGRFTDQAEATRAIIAAVGRRKAA